MISDQKDEHVCRDLHSNDHMEEKGQPEEYLILLSQCLRVRYGSNR